MIFCKVFPIYILPHKSSLCSTHWICFPYSLWYGNICCWESYYFIPTLSVGILSMRNYCSHTVVITCQCIGLPSISDFILAHKTVHTSGSTCIEIYDNSIIFLCYVQYKVLYLSVGQSFILIVFLKKKMFEWQFIM